MVWTHRTFMQCDGVNGLMDINDLRTRLSEFHSTNEHGLNTVIQLSNEEWIMGTNRRIIFGTVFDEHFKTSNRIIRNEITDGLPSYTIENTEHIDIRYGDFWFVNDGMILAKRKSDRTFILKALSAALDLRINETQIDIERVAIDYTDNWLGRIVDRSGNWQTGTVHGDNLREDDCIGNEFSSCTKNQLGSYTESLGGRMKFRVTKGGVVSVYTGLEIVEFLRFVRQDLLEYFVYQ